MRNFETNHQIDFYNNVLNLVSQYFIKFNSHSNTPTWHGFARNGPKGICQGDVSN